MITLELKSDRDLYGELLEGINEYRENLLNAASEYYGITKEELEQILLTGLEDCGEKVTNMSNEANKCPQIHFQPYKWTSYPPNT